LQRVHCQVDPDALVSGLSVAEQQLVEIVLRWCTMARSKGFCLAPKRPRSGSWSWRCNSLR